MKRIPSSNESLILLVQPYRLTDLHRQDVWQIYIIIYNIGIWVYSLKGGTSHYTPQGGVFYFHTGQIVANACSIETVLT